MAQPQARAIQLLDTQQFGVPGRGAAFLIHAPVRVLIETGTARASASLLDRLDPCPPQFIFVTHIHLDHAGASGHILHRFPEALVGVHARGVRHLERPNRLIEGVRAASPDVFPLYGAPCPIHGDRMLPLKGGERFDLGDAYLLETIATPGHAPHHVCYFEHRTRTLFTGDAVGNWQLPVDVPLTVPPGFDLGLGLESIRALRHFAPQRLAFTHFGISDHAMEELDRYERELVDWFEKLRCLHKSLSDDEVVEHILVEPHNAALSTLDQSLVEMCIRGGLMSLSAD